MCPLKPNLPWCLPPRPNAGASVERPLARARLLTQIQVGPLSPDLAGLDIDHTAILDQPLEKGSCLPVRRPGETQLVIDRPGRMEVRTVARPAPASDTQ